MFGHNEKVGKKYFENAGNKLYVTSIFCTLQGEGPYRGMPAVFVRLAKCNLSCSFCDTYFDSGDWLTISEIEQKIEDAINVAFPEDRPEYTRHNGIIVKEDKSTYLCSQRKKMVLVVTGGEPTLQDNLVPFLQHMNLIFENTQIESNGIIYQEIPSQTTLVVSPKCVEKDGKPIKYLQPNDKVLDRANCLKFVYDADPHSPYSHIPDWALKWTNYHGKKEIYISPMNIYNSEPQKSKQLRSKKNDITLEDRSQVDEVISFWEPGLLNMKRNQENHEYAAKYCMKHGLILNLQVHLYCSLA